MAAAGEAQGSNMALGYELSGTGPRLIANAGNAMSESIRQVGQQIRADVIQHNTDKQVVGLLNEAQRLNVNSETFSNDLVGVLSRYPMAANDDRAKLGIGLLGKAWQQQQEMAQLGKTLGSRENIARIRGQNGGGLASDLPPFAAGDDLPLPEPPAFGANLGAEPGMQFGAGQQATPGPFGASAGNGMAFGAGARDRLGVGFTPPEGDGAQAPAELPPIPDGQNPLFQMDRDLRAIPGLPARDYARTMARTRERAETQAMRPKNPITKTVSGIGLVEYNPETKEWNTAVGAKAPRKFLNVGSKLIDVETKEEFPIELTPKQAADLVDKDEAATVKAANREQDVVIKNLRDKRDEFEGLRKDYVRQHGKAEGQRKAELEAAITELNSNIDLFNSRIDEISSAKTADKTTGTRIIDRGGKKYEVDDATKKVLREVK